MAQENAEALGVAGARRLVRGDWRQPTWHARVSADRSILLVSNPPYIEAGVIGGLMPEVARFEPRLALDGGPDGLAAYRAIAAAARPIVAGRTHSSKSGAAKPLKYRGFFSSPGLSREPPWKDLGGVDGWSRPNIKGLAITRNETTF